MSFITSSCLCPRANCLCSITCLSRWVSCQYDVPNLQLQFGSFCISTLRISTLKVESISLVLVCFYFHIDNNHSINLSSPVYVHESTVNMLHNHLEHVPDVSLIRWCCTSSSTLLLLSMTPVIFNSIRELLSLLHLNPWIPNHAMMRSASFIRRILHLLMRADQ